MIALLFKCFMIFSLAVSVEILPEVCNHPVHILCNDGTMNPSSLIPFCSFEGNMTIMRTQTQHLDVPVSDVVYDFFGKTSNKR